MFSLRDSKSNSDMLVHHGQGVGPRGEPDLLRAFLRESVSTSMEELCKAHHALMDGMTWAQLRHEHGTTRADSPGQ